MFIRIVSMLILPLVISGCVSVKTTTNKQGPALPQAGVFKTETKGETWVQKGDLFITGGAPKRLGYSDIKFINIDPSDPSALYVGTDTGLYYSYNRGEGWFKTLEGKGVVNDIAVDPADKCTIYAAVTISIYKTTDCARSWNVIHFSSLKGQFFTSLLVSKSDSNIVFAGASNGTLLYSKNAGVSWEVLRMFEGTIITRLMAHPKDPRTFYLITPQYGIQKTTDNAATWTSLHDLPVRAVDGSEMLTAKDKPMKLAGLKDSKKYYDLQFDISQTEGLIYASGYGIFRLINGEYWQEIEILSKPRQEKIFTIALDATGQYLYFATTGAFYRSENGGKDWSVRKLPASGEPRFLSIAPDAPGELYLGFYAPPKK